MSWKESDPKVRGIASLSPPHSVQGCQWPVREGDRSSVSESRDATRAGPAHQPRPQAQSQRGKETPSLITFSATPRRKGQAPPEAQIVSLQMVFH